MSLRASLAYLGVRALAGGMGMLALAMFVRVLGPTQYAQFSLGMAAAALLSCLVIIPLNTSLGRLYGEASLRPALLGAVAAMVLGAGGVFCLLALLLELLGFSWLFAGVLAAAGLFAALQGALDYAAQVATAAQAPGRYSRLLLWRALGVSGFGALALWLGGGAAGVLLGMALACLLGLWASGSLARLDPRPAARAVLPRIVGMATPLLLACALAYALQWGDRYLLARWLPLAELGRYAALADFTQQALLLLASGLNSAWYPRVVEAWGRGDAVEAERLMSRYALMGLAFLLPAGAGLASVLAPLASSVFGPAYAGLPEALPGLLVLAACVFALKSFFFDVPLLLAQRVWRMSAGIGLSALVALGLMTVLVPRWGLSGAAAGLLAGQLAGLVFSLLAGRGVLRLGVDGRGLACIVCATLGMLALLWSLPRTGLPALLFAMLLAAAAYALLLLLLDFDGLRARLWRRWQGRVS